jgi:hypothetical protein
MRLIAVGEAPLAAGTGPEWPTVPCSHVGFGGNVGAPIVPLQPRRFIIAPGGRRLQAVVGRRFT